MYQYKAYNPGVIIMKEVSLEVGGYEAVIKDGKVLISIDDDTILEIHKDQIFMLSKILEKMD